VPVPEVKFPPLGHSATFFKKRARFERLLVQKASSFLSLARDNEPSGPVGLQRNSRPEVYQSKTNFIRSLARFGAMVILQRSSRAYFGRHDLFWKPRLTSPFSRVYGNELSGPSPAAAPIPGAQICIPGTSVSCTCPTVGLSSTANGMLYCNSNGSAYSSCICQPQREALLLIRWVWKPL
jgi:hypothetical protein